MFIVFTYFNIEIFGVYGLSTFIQEHKKLLHNANSVLILAAKVSSNPQALDKMSKLLGRNMGKVVEPTNPITFSSGSLTNHLNKTAKIAHDVKTDIPGYTINKDKVTILKDKFNKH